MKIRKATMVRPENLKTLAEMDATPRIHRLYPEFNEIYTRRNTLTDRLAQLEARAMGRPSFEKRLDKLFEQREEADADLVGIQRKIAREHPELAYRKPPAIEKAKAVKGKAETKYKELMKPRLEAHDREIKVVNDDFMAGKMSLKEMNEKHKAITKKTDAVAATMRKRVWGEYPEALPISKRGLGISRRTPRISPKVGRLK